MEKCHNYIKIDNHSLFFDEYAYIDCAENVADHLFIQEKVKVYFGKEFSNKNGPYHVVFCKIRKKDKEGFMRALEKLENKMLLFGYHDYPESSTKIINMLSNDTQGKKL